ncbi:MAG: glutathione S-transferase family protein [Gammaproteobacteria bacterium]|nr:glutathione S-transferase family protein [Gammaproteobacteria bacterium]
MTLTVWGGATSRTMRAHWALHELGVDYQPQLIGSRTGATQLPEFRALNAKEKIPVLVDDDFVLTESAAIVTYLGDKYGGLTPPHGSRERARYNEWTSYILMELDAHTLYVMRKHRDLANLYGEAPAAITAAQQGFDKQILWGLPQIETNEYAIGDSFGGVDILLTTCLDWAVAYGFDLADAYHAYRARQHDRPAFQSARDLNFSITAGA